MYYKSCFLVFSSFVPPRTISFSLSLLFSTVLILNLAGPALSAVSDSAKAADNGSSANDDENAIRSGAKEYCQAFASGDTEKLLMLWSDSAIFQDRSGNFCRGKEELKAQYEKFFRENRAPALEINIESISFPAADIALETGQTSISSQQTGSLASRYLATHVKRDGKWLLETVSESPALSRKQEDYLRPLSFLIGSWKAQGPEADLNIDASWLNKTAILCQAEFRPKNGTAKSFKEYIFVDPLSTEINSILFGDAGTVTRSCWQQEGKNWIKHSFSIESDGLRSRADYLLTPLTDDSFHWQSVRRRLSGTPLPDTPQILVQRNKQTK